jgi:hypothetical protein
MKKLLFTLTFILLCACNGTTKQQTTQSSITEKSSTSSLSFSQSDDCFEVGMEKAKLNCEDIKKLRDEIALKNEDLDKKFVLCKQELLDDLRIILSLKYSKDQTQLTKEACQRVEEYSFEDKDCLKYKMNLSKTEHISLITYKTSEIKKRIELCHNTEVSVDDLETREIN